MAPHDDQQHVPGPSLWPVGFAIGIVVLLVGLVVSYVVVAVGAVIAIAFAFLWVRDLTAGTALAQAPEVAPENAAAERALEPASPEARYPRAKFLELSTLGLGGVIGGLVSVPAFGFMIVPSLLKQGFKDHDVGPLTDFPEGKYVVTTFTSDESEGIVSRRTAYIRYNGTVEVKAGTEKQAQPSFTILSNHCAHLGCPVQPNGPLDTAKTEHYKDVTLVPAISIAGFGCPCHGGQYDPEGNRIAGPPVRALDRYSFSIRNGHLWLGSPFSVSEVTGTGATATIHEHTFAFPGEHVNGIESWLYPLQPPH